MAAAQRAAELQGHEFARQTGQLPGFGLEGRETAVCVREDEVGEVGAEREAERLNLALEPGRELAGPAHPAVLDRVVLGLGEHVQPEQAAEQAGFDLVACFDHVCAAPRGMAAWDAPSLLAAIALHTEQVLISAEVINASLRYPFLLAGQLAVAQAASGGRLRAGLGAARPISPVSTTRPSAFPSHRTPNGSGAWRRAAVSCRRCGAEHRGRARARIGSGVNRPHRDQAARAVRRRSQRRRA